MTVAAVDRASCQGHARCVSLCPDVFDLDDDGLAVVLAVSIEHDLLDPVKQAVANCPERAISIIEEQDER